MLREGLADVDKVNEVFRCSPLAEEKLICKRDTQCLLYDIHARFLEYKLLSLAHAVSLKLDCTQIYSSFSFQFCTIDVNCNNADETQQHVHVSLHEWGELR